MDEHEIQELQERLLQRLENRRATSKKGGAFKIKSSQSRTEKDYYGYLRDKNR